MFSRHFSVVCFVLVSAVISAQTIRTADVDAIALEEMRKQHIPGLSIAVIEKGIPIHLKAYGKANLEWNIDATVDCPFKIASVSKQFICTAILKLAEEGKLAVEDPLSKYFPDAPAFWSKITLRRLMSHTSGLPRELPGWTMTGEYTEADWLKMAYEAKPIFEPGEKYAYCNVGYFLLSIVISKVTEKPWSDYIIDTIFKPNGMTSSRATSGSDIIPNRVSGYSWRTDKWVNDGPLLSIRPSGAFLCSIRDLAKWEETLYNRRFLKPESYALQFAPTPLIDGKTNPYGMGWGLGKSSKGEQMIEHGGALLGFRSDYARNLDRGVTVIVLANSDSANCAAISTRVFDLFRRK